MSDAPKRDVVRTRSIGMPGRALNSARSQHFVLDSSSGPSEALTNTEAFLAGISSCGVTLIEKYAAETGVPLSGMDVEISGIRAAGEPRFESIDIRFDLDGVDQAEAVHLVEVWQAR